MYTQVQFKSANDAERVYKLRQQADEFSNITLKLEENIIIYDGHRKDGYDSYGDTNIFLAVGAKTSFTALLDSKQFYDVKLTVVDGNKEHTRRLHKIILSNMTDFFDVAFSSVNKTGKVMLTINEPIDLFGKIIDIIYGKVTRIHGVDGLKVLQIMDKYGVKFNQYVEEEFEFAHYIGEMGIPAKEEVVEYLKTLGEIILNIDDVDRQIDFHIHMILDMYMNDDKHFLNSVKEYLPRNVLKDAKRRTAND